MKYIVSLLFLFNIQTAYSNEALDLESIPSDLIHQCCCQYLNCEDTARLTMVSQYFNKNLDLEFIASNSQEGIYINGQWKFVQELDHDTLIDLVIKSSDFIMQNTSSEQVKIEELNKLIKKFSTLFRTSKKSEIDDFIDFYFYLANWDQFEWEIEELILEELWAQLPEVSLQEIDDFVRIEAHQLIKTNTWDQIWHKAHHHLNTKQKKYAWNKICLHSWEHIKIHIMNKISDPLKRNLSAFNFKDPIELGNSQNSLHLPIFYSFTLFHLASIILKNSDHHTQFKSGIISSLSSNNPSHFQLHHISSVVIPEDASNLILKNSLRLIKNFENIKSL